MPGPKTDKTHHNSVYRSAFQRILADSDNETAFAFADAADLATYKAQAGVFEVGAGDAVEFMVVVDNSGAEDDFELHITRADIVLDETSPDPEIAHVIERLVTTIPFDMTTVQAVGASFAADFSDIGATDVFVTVGTVTVDPADTGSATSQVIAMPGAVGSVIVPAFGSPLMRALLVFGESNRSGHVFARRSLGNASPI